MARTSLLDFSATRLYKTTTSSKGTFTVDTDDDYIVDATHGMVVGDLVTFTTTDTLPAGLTVGVIYSVWQFIDSGNFMVSIDGYQAVNITNSGTGTHSYAYYNTNVTISNFVVNQDQAIEEGFFHTSVLTGHKEWITKGYHWYLEIKTQLFRTASLSTRRTNFDTLHGYLYTDIYVARCNESQGTSLIRNASSVPIKFIMHKFETSFLTQANYEDILTIGLTSKDYIDMSKTV
jgi:hypothetical protein